MVVDPEAGLGVILLSNRMGETDPLVEVAQRALTARKGVLTLLNPWGNTTPLEPVTDSRFRIGSHELSPETLEFSAIVDGRALRSDYTGCPYYRTFEP